MMDIGKRRRGRPRKALQIGAEQGQPEGEQAPEVVDALSMASRLGHNVGPGFFTGTAVAEIFSEVYEDGTLMIARLHRDSRGMQPFLLAKGDYYELVGPELDGKRLAAFRERAEKWA